MQVHVGLPIEDLGSLRAAEGSVDILTRIVLRWAARAALLPDCKDTASTA